MKKIIFSLFVVLTLLMGVNLELKSQTPPDCQGPDCGPWAIVGDGTKTIAINDGCSLVVQFEVRLCNGVAEFRILGWSQTGVNCTLYSAQTLKEMAFVGILEGFGGNAALCGEGTATTVHIFIGSCVYEQVCTYSYPGPPMISCNPSGTTPPELALSTRTTRRHIPCGTVCCKTIFEVCRINKPSGGSYVKATQIGPSVSYGSCVSTDPLPPGAICLPICN